MLFFQKGEPTKKTCSTRWTYTEYGETNPLDDEDLKESDRTAKTMPETEKSWTLVYWDVNAETYDLRCKNPNIPEETPLEALRKSWRRLKNLDMETNAILESIKELI